MREARREYFEKHSPNITTYGMHDLSEVFRCMAESAKLLGLAIYEIQEVSKGPDELQQANYALRSLPKGLKFLWVVPPSESPKVMGLVGIHGPDTLCHFNDWPTAPGVGRRARMRKQLLTTCRWYTTGFVWCLTNVTTTHEPHQTLFTTMVGKTVHPQKRKTPMNQFHQSNCQQGTGIINLS